MPSNLSNKIPKDEKSPDIYIGLMGMTGVGKSSFIKKLTGDPDITIGHSLTSCTQEIQPAKMTYFSEQDKRSYDVWLVDTPGYDDTSRTDTDTLLTFVDWLKLHEKNDLKLSGLIYLHRITDDRLGGTAMRNLGMMQNLVGDDNLGNVVLVTSRWEIVDPEVGEMRESRDLLGEGGFWHTMKKLGADNARYNGSVESARAIIKRIVSNSPIYLKIQDELQSGMHLQETAAGKALIDKLEQAREKQEKLLEEQRKAMEEQQQKLEKLQETMAKGSVKMIEQQNLILQEQKKSYDTLLAKLAKDEAERKTVAEADKKMMQARVDELQERLNKRPKWMDDERCVIT